MDAPSTTTFLKFCKFQLVINVAAVVVSALAPFFGIEEPLKVTHLLFVNLVMDGLGAIMLGNEPALEKKYMHEKPRRRDESIISKSMMAQIVTMGLWLTILSFAYLKLDVPWLLCQRRTIAVVLFCIIYRQRFI